MNKNLYEECLLIAELEGIEIEKFQGKNIKGETEEEIFKALFKRASRRERKTKEFRDRVESLRNNWGIQIAV